MAEEQQHWDDRYRELQIPWETGRASTELVRVVGERSIAACKTLELGCGLGNNAVWLALKGFEVTAIDFSHTAIHTARERAEATGAKINFLEADVRSPPAELTGPFDFVFDRGCYHVVRQSNLKAYLRTLGKLTHAGTQALFLTGNANEKHEPGPPVVTEEAIRREIGELFEIVELREFRFDQGMCAPVHFLGWSCFAKRK